MNETELRRMWQDDRTVPEIDFGSFMKHVDAWRNKLQKKAMLDTWIQVGAAGILVGMAFYNPKLIALSAFCVAVVIWYVRELHKFYNADNTEMISADLKQSLNLKIAMMKGYFLRTRILMYAVMPLSVPAIFYAFGSFDPPSIKVWYWTFTLFKSLVIFEIITIVATEIGFVLTYRPALTELKELLKELDSNQ